MPANTRLSYFAQHAAETLDGTATVLDAVEEIAPPEWRPRLRSLLGSFLFSGDDVFKLCRILSGGERQRVALARILLTPANMLLLDEPTHHLDLAGKEVLESALEQYPGAVIVVTHDRSLMARLATRILEVNDGRVIPYPGGYDDYESARLARAEGERGGASVPAPAVKPSPSGGTLVIAKPAASEGKRTGGKKSAAGGDGRGAKTGGNSAPAPSHHAGGESREQRSARQKREKEQSRIERDIEARDATVKTLENQLADPDVYANPARSRELIGEYEKLKTELASLWQKLETLG